MTKITFFFDNWVFQYWKKKRWKFKFQKWSFLTTCGHFYGNYLNIFHETEIQTVILRCLMSLNLNWYNWTKNTKKQKKSYILRRPQKFGPSSTYHLTPLSSLNKKWNKGQILVVLSEYLNLNWKIWWKTDKYFCFLRALCASEQSTLVVKIKESIVSRLGVRNKIPFSFLSSYMV